MHTLMSRAWSGEADSGKKPTPERVKRFPPYPPQNKEGLSAPAYTNVRSKRIHCRVRGAWQCFLFERSLVLEAVCKVV